MTSAEREHALEYLERTKSAMLTVTGSLTEIQWRFKPEPAEWSPAECVEHIALVEANLFETLLKIAAGPCASSEDLTKCAGKERLIERAVPARAVKVQAPDLARPTNRFADRAELIAHFIATRDRTIDYVRTTTDSLRQRIYSHFVLGPLDGYQWLIFLAAHGERHLNQLLEVIAVESRARQTGVAPA